ncbi:MAG: ABC transporter ATP-binding protein [Myxococcota bacterium]
MSAAVLELREVVVERRSKTGAFRLEVDALAVEPGEVLVVLGPNGAGKSTLLRVLAGLESDVTGRLHGIGPETATLVFQQPALFSGTVLHNVRVALRGRGVPRDAADAKALRALERFGMEGLAGRRVGVLSGGERRRTALARAFAVDPKVLLLDEPFDDLDLAAQRGLANELRQLAVAEGIAIVMVTHDLRGALPLADRVAVLLDGKLRQVGPRDAVLSRPADAAVAALVGMENLWSARIEAEGAVVGSDLVLPPPADAESGARGSVGLRPEHLCLGAVDDTEAIALPSGTVQALRDDGQLVRVHVLVGQTDLRGLLLSGSARAQQLAEGAPVALAVRARHLHWMPEPRAKAE